MESDYALVTAYDILQKVNSQELPFERTLRTSDTENTHKDQILGRMPGNLKTIGQLLEQNAADWVIIQDEQSGKKEKQAARDRMVIRRRKLCTLTEELSVRTHRLDPHLQEDGADGRSGWPRSSGLCITSVTGRRPPRKSRRCRSRWPSTLSLSASSRPSSSPA